MLVVVSGLWRRRVTMWHSEVWHWRAAARRQRCDNVPCPTVEPHHQSSEHSVIDSHSTHRYSSCTSDVVAGEAYYFLLLKVHSLGKFYCFVQRSQKLSKKLLTRPISLTRFSHIHNNSESNELHCCDIFVCTVASLGCGPPRLTPSRGVTPEGKNLWANLQRIVEKRGRTGKKGAGWHPGGWWHPSESNKKR